MRFHSSCYENMIWKLALCFLVQCLITSESKVHVKRSIVEKNETVAQKQKQTGVAVRENTSNDTKVSKNRSASLQANGVNRTKVIGNVTGISTGVAMQVDNSSSETSQETVQPSRKIISTGAFVRAFYVFVGVGAIVVMYIVVRTVRLRRRKSTVRKYGILASRGDVELTPLGLEDEDEDTTMFEIPSHKSRP